MWWNILKQPKLSLSPKTFTAFKIPPKEEEEGDCNRRLKEYYNKLKNRQLSLYLTLNQFQLHSDNFNVDKIEVEYNKQTYVNYWPKGRERWSGSMDMAQESISHKYEPVPEPVACKALEWMKENSDRKPYPDNYIEIDGIKYFITIKKIDDKYHREESLIIAPQRGKNMIYLAHYIKNMWDNPEHIPIPIEFSFEEKSNYSDIDVSWM